MSIKSIKGKLRSFLSLRTNVILLIIIFILVIALGSTTALGIRKSQRVRAVSATITDNEELLDKANDEIDRIKSQLNKEQQENSELQSQLEQKQKEKSELEQQIGSLKSQIEQMKANKGNIASPPVEQTVVPPQNIPEGDKVCYLTFDDGPSQNTLKILDILGQYNVKATFFVIDSPHASYIKNEFDAGHTIGLHTSSHVYSSIYSSVDAYFSDLQSISDKVEQITGAKSGVIRFPGGSSNLVSKKYCNGIMTQLVTLVGERGFSYFDWNVSSGDAESRLPSAAKICSNVLKGASGKNSICVLMHDASAKTTTVTALPSIIEGLSAMGFRFDSIKPDTYGFHHSILNN